MSIKDQMKQDAQEHGMNQNSNFFQFDSSGDYRLRILTEAKALATHFFGKGNASAVCYGMEKGCPFHNEGAPKDKDGNPKPATVKYIAYVIDRRDGQVKLAELPWSVLARIGDFEEDEDFKFQGYPMPYDIKVKVNKESKDPKSFYKTEASPKAFPITEEERNSLTQKMGKMTPEQFIQMRKNGQVNKHNEDGTTARATAARRESLKSEASAKVENRIEYPTDEINPDDIPF